MIDMEFFTIMTTVLEIYFYFLFFHLFTPYPAFPQGGRGWFYISPLGENERGLGVNGIWVNKFV